MSPAEPGSPQLGDQDERALAVGVVGGYEHVV